MISNALISGILAMIIAQWVKVPIYYYKNKKWDWEIALSTGSMPSSHTALVVSVTTAVGLIEGVDSSIFAVSMLVALITIHDAVKVRGESGKQAKIINQLTNDLQLVYESLDMKKSFSERETKLKELIGHTTIEVIGGIFVGLLVAIIYLYLNNVI